jgi:uncharacterized protein
VTEKEAIALLASMDCSSRVIEHCKVVSQLAREMALNIMTCAQKKGIALEIDIEAIILGGLLHDIGRSITHGIDHAVAGARIAREISLNEKLVNIIERHIGAGITMEEAVSLGLPEKDYLPRTIEEKIVAHADNLVSGSRVITLNELMENVRKKKFNEKIIQRIIKLDNEISAMMC